MHISRDLRIAFWWQHHQCDVYWLTTLFFNTMSHCFAIEVIFICLPLVKCIIALNVFLHMCLCFCVFYCVFSLYDVVLKYVACFVVTSPFVMLHTQCWICNQCTNIVSSSTSFPHLSATSPPKQHHFITKSI